MTPAIAQMRTAELMDAAHKYMDLLGLSVHWHPSGPACIAAQKIQRERQFHAAVDTLEKLVVQHIFELQKYNMGSQSMLNLFTY